MKILRNTLKLLQMPFKSAPVTASAVFLIHIIREIIPIIKIMFMALLIDNIYGYLLHINAIKFEYICLFLLITLYEKISPDIEDFFGIKLKNEIWKKYTLELIDCWGNAKYTCIENEILYLKFKRIKENIHEQVYRNYINVIGFYALCINILVINIYVSFYSAIAGMMMFIMSVLISFISIIGGKIEYKATVESHEMQVRANYLEEILTSKEAAYERQIFSYSKEISEKWKEKYKISSSLKLNAEKRFLQQYQSVGIVGTAISMFMVFLFATMLINKEIGYGVFVSLVSNAVTLSKSLSSSINQHIRNYVKGIEFVEDYNDIIKIPREQLIITDDVKFEKISIRNLRYRYPNGKYVLDDLNMDIEYGKKYALIGENGAGKTTLIKVLVGLYRDYEGEILIDGKELKDNPQYYNLFATVFQDYLGYNLSLRDNLTMGLNHHEYDDESLRKVLEKYGLGYIIGKLHIGLDTILGKQIEDSDNLSGGEWQKIALARMDIDKKCIKIYDEPTSSLDPISESEVYSKLFSKIQDETFIVISHRLGIASMVDCIYVLDKGKIQEKGTVKELIKKDGLFSKMYDNQKEWYS